MSTKINDDSMSLDIADNPWSADHDGLPEAHFGGYVSRTVSGRILD